MDGTVLIADDDRTIRTVLTQALTRAGCRVHATGSLAQLSKWVEEGRGDLVITDVMMPDGNGIDRIPAIREARPDLPVIVISAQNTIVTAIRATEASVFDYLPKPFEPRELLLRIGAILRRVPAPEVHQPKFLTLGALRYDIDKGELWQGENHLRLTGTEQSLLRRLADTPRQPVSRSALIEDLGRGPAEEPGENSERAIDVQITRLRRKIEPDPREPRYLQTVRGTGYMLVPD